MELRRRKRQQDSLWVATAELARTGGHMFYERVNCVMDEQGFDRFAEDTCEKFYAPLLARPEVAPGVYLPDKVDRLLRRLGFRPRRCLAMRRFARYAGVTGRGADRFGAGLFDRVADTAPDRSGNRIRRYSPG